jgi:ADP-L-glycero-D-manno-heptose 6-epimerase
MFERYALKRQEFAEHVGDRIQGFRYFNVYGPDGEEHKGNQASPFAQFKKQTDATGEIRLFENSEHYLRDFVHVSQVVNTHLKFFKVKESGIWNVGTGTTMSFRAVAETFNANIVDIPMPGVLKSSYQSYTCADITKLSTTISKVNYDS